MLCKSLNFLPKLRPVALATMLLIKILLINIVSTLAWTDIVAVHLHTGGTSHSAFKVSLSKDDWLCCTAPTLITFIPLTP